MMASKFTFVSHFSGIGAGDLGLYFAGFTCLAHIEADRRCREVLAHHWPAVPNFEDIRTIDLSVLPEADLHLVTDPCQCNTAANSRYHDRPRECLWPYSLAIIAAKRPQYVCRENPTRQRRNAPATHETVAIDLEELGYVSTIIDCQAGEVCGVSRRRTIVAAGLGPAGHSLRKRLDQHRCTIRDWPKDASSAMPFAALTCHPYRYDSRDNFIAYPDGRIRVLSHGERLRAQGLPETWLDCLGRPSLWQCAQMSGNALPVYLARWFGDIVRRTHDGCL
jgi:DNA (cytosine-5)-methyltransferase 1